MIPGLYDQFQRWANQTVWVYSDTHFGDTELAAGQPNRPSDAEHVKMINQYVGRKDTLILLGDCGDLEYVKQLRGYKVLIMGNHEVCKTSCTDVFDEVYEGALIVGEKLILSHEPVDIPWLHNLHGHNHAGRSKPGHTNVCSDACGYKPLNLNQFMKNGGVSKIESIHRITIDKATANKKKRKGKKIHE